MLWSSVMVDLRHGGGEGGSHSRLPVMPWSFMTDDLCCVCVWGGGGGSHHERDWVSLKKTRKVQWGGGGGYNSILG